MLQHSHEQILRSTRTMVYKKVKTTNDKHWKFELRFTLHETMKRKITQRHNLETKNRDKATNSNRHCCVSKQRTLKTKSQKHEQAQNHQILSNFSKADPLTLTSENEAIRSKSEDK